MENNKLRTIYIYAALAAIAIIPFAPSLNAPFAVLDDYDYIVANEMIHGITFSNLISIFTKAHLNNYLPVHMITYSYDYAIWGENPVYYRAENFLWHAAGVILLFIAILRLVGHRGAAFFGAAMYAVHPVLVESVSWIAERKNLLSQVFLLLSYIYYMKRADARRNYAISLVYCAVALMSKASAVVLPMLLMLHDFFIDGERNPKKLLIDKLPYFALCVLMGVITILVQDINPEIGEIRNDTVIEKVMTMSVIWIRYARMTLWPFNLSGAYEVTNYGLHVVPVIALIGIILLFTLAYRASFRNNIIGYGVFWFYVSLLPVSNIIPFPVGVKDRYLMLPMAGAAMIFAWAYAKAAARKPQLTRGLATLAVIALAVTTALRAREFSDLVAYWRTAVRVAPRSAEAHSNLSFAWLHSGGGDLNVTIETGVTQAIRKGLPTDKITVARLFLDRSAPAQALAVAKKYLPAAPGDPRLLTTIGMSSFRLGQMDAAQRFLGYAIERNSTESLTYLGMGLILESQGRLEEAFGHYRRAYELDPTNADVNLKLATLLENTDPASAAAHYRRALASAPEHPQRDVIREKIRRLEGAR